MRLLGFVLLLALPAGRALAAPPPNVVFITLDTTRADRMGFLGSKRGLTPGLDALARESVVFERAYAQAPLTTVSHATVLSGTYPQFHKVNDFGVRLPEALPYLPALLHDAGYRTAAFVGSLILDPRNGLAPGFDRGFDTYDAGFRIRRGREDRYATMERRASEVVDRAVQWLSAERDRPFFLWVHLYDAHDPYEPPPAFARAHPGAPYDGEIAAVDASLGTLFAALRTRGAYDNSVVAVFADHGEALGEGGEQTHGVFLYEATQHVPLLLRLPGRAGARVASRVSLVDLAPTVLEALGRPVPAAMQGASLLPLAGAAAAADREAYAETDYPRRAFGWSPIAAYRAEQYLFVQAPRPELYDLGLDPKATRNLVREKGAIAERLSKQMRELQRRTGKGEGPGSAPAASDPDLAQRLAALGYVGGNAPAARGPAIDPKDKVSVANTLHEAIVAVENGQTARAVPLLEKVIATDPQIPVAQMQLGVAMARERRYAAALPPLRKAIELQPESMQAHYEIGVALFETGDLKTAAGHLEIVATRMPKWADARYSYASVLARIARVPEAVSELRAALELQPGHYRANLLLGRILSLQGRPADGLPYLLRAVDAQPGSAEAQSFLADAYQALGRAGEAEQARARARQLRSGPAPP
jgi:arylsulfatase A-like enzyme/Flp pilus assembly protein TadD